MTCDFMDLDTKAVPAPDAAWILHFDPEFAEKKSGVESTRVETQPKADPYKIHQVVKSLDEDSDVQSVMGEIVRLLRAGNDQVAFDLYLMARGDLTIDPDLRSLALETLSAARVRSLGRTIRQLVLTLLRSGDEGIRFAAIAAAGDLPYEQRVSLRGTISQIALEDPDSDVEAAAKTFIEHARAPR